MSQSSSQGTPFSSSSPSATAVLILVGTTTTTAVLAVVWLRRLVAAVGVAPPTAEQVAQENPTQHCALLRHLPAVRLAWRSLGVTQPSPLHVCTLPSSHGKHKLQFWLKREDLIGSKYPGNKVRTLQHQLAVCQAKRQNGNRAYRHLVVLGTGGSNQVVAATVHARTLGWNGKTTRNKISKRFEALPMFIKSKILSKWCRLLICWIQKRQWQFQIRWILNNNNC